MQSHDILWCNPKIPSPQGFIFDWEGTLVSSQDFLMKAYYSVFSEFQVKLPPISFLMSQPEQRVFDIFLPQVASEASQKFNKLIQEESSKSLGVFDGVFDLLTDLYEKDYPLYVISNGKGAFLRKTVELLNWDHFFKKIVGGDDFVYNKPDPEVVWKTFELDGETPRKSIWFVGDSLIDARCAEAAGCSSVYVINKASESGLVLSEFDLVLRKTSDLKKILTELQ